MASWLQVTRSLRSSGSPPVLASGGLGRMRRRRYGGLAQTDVRGNMRDRPTRLDRQRTPRSIGSSGYFLGCGMTWDSPLEDRSPRFSVSVKFQLQTLGISVLRAARSGRGENRPA
jgi:hypothetical protein